MEPNTPGKHQGTLDTFIENVLTHGCGDCGGLERTGADMSLAKAKLRAERAREHSTVPATEEVYQW